MARADRTFLQLLAAAALAGAVLASPLAITLFPGELQRALHGARGLALACAAAVYRLGEELPPLGVAVLALSLMSLGLAGARLATTLRHTRALLHDRRLTRAPGRLRRAAAELGLAGRVVCYADARPVAYCAGLLRPRIWVSSAAVHVLARDELAAVLTHEAHHLRRRDPLRLVVARVLASALFALPAVRALAERFALAVELDADRAALNVGGVAPLAGALYKLAPQPGLTNAAVGAWSASHARVAQLSGAPDGSLLAPTPGRAGRLTTASLALALLLAAGQAARANLVPAVVLDAFAHGRAAADVHVCPLPMEGILL